MTEALGILIFNSGVCRGCLVYCYWRVVDIGQQFVDRDTVDTACNGMKRCTAKSQMQALVTKSSRVMWTSTPPTLGICPSV